MKRVLISLAMLAIASGAAQARVCIVSNLDTSGCQLGDELLYLPRSDGNEQLPLEFVAKKCDMNKTVAWTNSGVACIYAGDKEMVNGHHESKRKAYATVYESAGGILSTWTQMDNGAYWKIRENGKGDVVKLGERIELAEKICNHDIDGEEHPAEDYTDAKPIEKLTKDHYVYKLKPRHGAIIEVVGETYHVFVKVK